MKRMIIFAVIISLFTTVVFPEDRHFIRLKEVAVSQIPEDLITHELGSVVVDVQGNVFGFSGRKNSKECAVIKWDEKLRFIKKFSRQGHGPGEISMAGEGTKERLAIDPLNGDVLVVDYNPTKLVIFDNNGNHKKDINLLQKNPVFGKYKKFRSLGKGRYAAFKSTLNTEPTSCVMFKLNPFEETMIHDFKDKPLYVDKSYGISYSEFYGSRSFIDIDSGYWTITNTQGYKFQIFDLEGKKLAEVFNPDKKRDTFTTAEIEYIKKTKFSARYLAMIKQNKHYFNKLFDLIKENKNPVREIRIGGSFIYLFLVNENITAENKIPVDIYDLKGTLIKKVYFKKIPHKIWKQFAYYIESDEEDNSVIRKYQIGGVDS